MNSENKKNLKNDEKGKLLQVSLSIYATFYPKYYLLETLLKNRLFQALKEKLGENWFSLQLDSVHENNLFKQEAEFILRRKPKKFVLKDKGLLLESGFGLWVEFFNRPLYKETKGLPILIFPKLPSTIKRKQIYQKLNNVKELRNQLFHYRLLPITETEQLKSLDKLIDANKDLMNLLDWLDAPLNAIQSNEFENKVDEIRKMLN